MRARARTEKPEACEAGALVAGIPADVRKVPPFLTDLDNRLGGAIGTALRLDRGLGERGRVTPLTARGAKAGRVLLLGLGKPDEFDLEACRDVAGRAARALRDAEITDAAVALPDAFTGRAGPADTARAVAEGARMGQYRFLTFKTEKAPGADLRALTLLVGEDQVRETRRGLRIGTAVADGVVRARDLANTPANALTPRAFAEEATALSASKGLGVKVLGPAEMERLGMGALLGVAQGSPEPARLIVLEHEGAGGDEPPICLVGKGVTFDSGGISLKPAANMWRLKTDMCGAAAVFGAMSALAALGVPNRVVGIIGAVENMPGGRAVKPGDVVRTMKGLTVEVQNTDAEGRLVLADALHYAATTYRPRAMVDFATLTGAVRVALGALGAGLVSDDDGLAGRLERASAVSGDRVWRLPLWEEHAGHLASDTTDAKNIGRGGEAGTLTAAHFLRKFTGDVPWAHLDIAAVARDLPERGHIPPGPTGAGVRLAVQAVLEWG